jgi:lipopolysaccharide/colanic/teichoic acid biosynthesis glycosyltransferase
MSLVGPRPLPNYHHAVLPPHARHVRERVRPGITGLWQIRGRSDLDIHEMARWDVYYVRNWSVWLDLLILAQTLWAIVSGRGAR